MSRRTYAVIVVSAMSLGTCAVRAAAGDTTVDITRKGVRVQVTPKSGDKDKTPVKETTAQRNARFVRSRVGGLRLLDSLRRRQVTSAERSLAQRNR